MQRAHCPLVAWVQSHRVAYKVNRVCFQPKVLVDLKPSTKRASMRLPTPTNHSGPKGTHSRAAARRQQHLGPKHPSAARLQNKPCMHHPLLTQGQLHACGIHSVKYVCGCPRVHLFHRVSLGVEAPPRVWLVCLPLSTISEEGAAAILLQEGH